MYDMMDMCIWSSAYACFWVTRYVWLIVLSMVCEFVGVYSMMNMCVCTFAPGSNGTYGDLH